MHFRLKTSSASLLITGALSLSAVGFAGEPHAKIAHDLQEVRGKSGRLAVIIQYKQAADDASDSRLTKLGAQIGGHLKGVKATSAVVSSDSLDSIESDSSVAHVSLDHPLGARGMTSISTNAEYVVEPINAPQVWSQGFDGTGIGIAVIDSGINPTQDLQPTGKGPSRIVYNQSFVPGELRTTNDAFGHGTHVAGLIAGDGSKSTGRGFFRTFKGIAPNARLINLRVLDENGQGSDSSVIQAIDQAIALKATYNIRVINLSLGRPIWESYQLDPLCQEVEKAWKAGIVVVVAAGNNGRNLSLNTEGYGTIEAPGNDPYVLTVGAVRTVGTPAITDDAIASYSSKGPSFIDSIAKPDVVAPGNLVTSLLVGKATLQVQNPQFFTPHSFYVTNGDAKASVDYFRLAAPVWLPALPAVRWRCCCRPNLCSRQTRQKRLSWPAPTMVCFQRTVL